MCKQSFMNESAETIKELGWQPLKILERSDTKHKFIMCHTLNAIEQEIESVLRE